MKKLLLLLALISSFAFGIEKKTPSGTTVKDKPGQSQSTVVPDPVMMTNAQATKLGLKEYLGNTAYNGGNQTTISGNNYLSANSSILIPYQTQGNAWRLKFHISYNPIGAASDEYIAINSVTCRASTNQTFVATNINGNLAIYYSTFLAATSQFRTIYSGANTSGRDVALESKPTWAY